MLSMDTFYADFLFEIFLWHILDFVIGYNIVQKVVGIVKSFGDVVINVYVFNVM